MRRKLMLARALLHDPQVLYLDEPTANLDIHSAAVVHRLLRERVQRGKTVVLTTHDMGEVEAICDRVGIICRGKLVALDTPLALKTAHAEHVADVVTRTGERHSFALADESERQALAALIQRGELATIRTREFDFHATFLKLTGQAFDQPPHDS
jgi:ABC-type multidrug transport system ATPase subunit